MRHAEYLFACCRVMPQGQALTAKTFFGLQIAGILLGGQRARGLAQEVTSASGTKLLNRPRRRGTREIRQKIMLLFVAQRAPHLLLATMAEKFVIKINIGNSVIGSPRQDVMAGLPSSPRTADDAPSETTKAHPMNAHNLATNPIDSVLRPDPRDPRDESSIPQSVALGRANYIEISQQFLTPISPLCRIEIALALAIKFSEYTVVKAERRLPIADHPSQKGPADFRAGVDVAGDFWLWEKCGALRSNASSEALCVEGSYFSLTNKRSLQVRFPGDLDNALNDVVLKVEVARSFARVFQLLGSLSPEPFPSLDRFVQQRQLHGWTADDSGDAFSSYLVVCAEVAASDGFPNDFRSAFYRTVLAWARIRSALGVHYALTPWNQQDSENNTDLMFAATVSVAI